MRHSSDSRTSWRRWRRLWLPRALLFPEGPEVVAGFVKLCLEESNVLSVLELPLSLTIPQGPDTP